MRELSMERIKIGEHILVDGVEYVAEEGGGCEECPMTLGGSALCGLCPIGGHIVRAKKEPKYRPYIDTAEMITDWMERFGRYDTKVVMPPIWVKNEKDEKYHVTDYYHYTVGLSTCDETLIDLFKGYTYLDGSPCGKEVKE